MKVGVFFGSRSCEHDVSIVTGLQAIQNIDSEKYEIVPVYIDRDGSWYTDEGLLNYESYALTMKKAYDVQRCVPAPYGDGKLALYKHPLRGGLFFSKLKPFVVIDVALLAFHGVNGEDGSIQGLLELYNVPYTSAGMFGSSVGMDKIGMKAFFRGCGFPVLPYAWFTRDRWEKEPNEVLMNLESELEYPMFVKPANLGSSIGISKAADRESLMEAIEVAKAYDRKILVEKGLVELDEINCAAVGYGESITVSMCEQPVSWQEFLTFDDKYMRSGGKGMESLTRQIPAPISRELTAQIQKLTEDIFRCMDMKGVMRVDFMIDKQSGNVYVNEVNTIPGSLSFYLFEPMGISYKQLLGKMIDSALDAHADKQRNNFSYDSMILTKVAAGRLKGGKGGFGKLGGKMGSVKR